MNFSIGARRTAIGLAVVLGCGAAAGTAAPDLARGPGLWEMKLTLDGGRYPIPMSQICLDARVGPKLTIAGPQMRRSACQTYEAAARPAGGWTLHSVCKLADGGRVETDGLIEGDLDSAYQVNATSVISGSSDPLRNGRHTIVIAARLASACPAGARGGDITVNGRTSNVFSSPG